MAFLEQIRLFFDTLETKTFYTYATIFFAICITLNGVIIFYYYSSIGALQRDIKKLNSERSERVLTILQQDEQVKQQRHVVDETLSKDPNFKLEGEFKALLATWKLTDKISGTINITTVEREDNYREVELSTNFEDIKMKEVLELLEALEKDPRIATKRLEITVSTKKPKTVEVQITITTLLPPKTEVA